MADSRRSSGTGVVASAHALASEAGAKMLTQGGNAFDAAVAVTACLNVVEPFMSGLAGMGYASMWVAAEQRVRVLDFVQPVPHSFPIARFSTREQLARGPQSVGAPGNLAGWAMLSRTYGRLGLGRVLEPAAALAADGFPIGRFGAEQIAEHAPELAAKERDGASFRDTYPSAPAVGTVSRQPYLAETLRRIGADGPDILYGGPLGERLVQHLAELGGTLDMEDLRAVRAVWRDPIAAPYRGLLVHTPPPPCEGFQFLLTMRVLDGLDLRQFEPRSAEHLDIVIRAIRLAAGVRIAHNNPGPERLSEILSDASVAALQARLLSGDGLQGPTEQWMQDMPGQEDPGHTTSFSVGDAEGNLICITQSLGSGFGSGIVVPETGVCLNNFLYWADVQPASPNRVGPGHALPICMAPSLSTLGGKPALALGTPGSYGILQTQAQAMVNHLDFGLELQEAISAPRCRLWDGKLVELEPRIGPEVIAALRAKGHDARALPSPWSMRVGGMQAIGREAETGRLTGAADPRRDGAVVALQRPFPANPVGG